MKKLTLIFVVILVVTILLGLLILKSRKSIKMYLPREGSVMKVGDVYTPYLLLDSTFYFLKHWDESLEVVSAKTYIEEAQVELDFANKRLLEMEELSRNGNLDYNEVLSDKFLSSIKNVVTFTKLASQNGEDIEELVWAIQESTQDQQRVFAEIIKVLPEQRQVRVLQIQERSTEELSGLLRSIYGFN